MAAGWRHSCLPASSWPILRENPPIGLEDMIVIETDETSGYALLRAFDGDPLAHKTLVEAMNAATCRPLASGD